MAFNPNASQLSGEQIIQQVFNPADNSLKVDATVVATIGDVVINADTSSVTIGNPNNSNVLIPNADGSINVDVVLTATADSIKSYIYDASGNAIGSTSGALNVAATQGTAANLNATVVTTGGLEIATNAELITINSTLGTPMQATGGT